MELKKVTLPLTALVIPVAAFGSWWVAHQGEAIEQLDADVRANREDLIQQQFDVNDAIYSLNTRQEVMAQNIESIRATLERLEKKIEEE